MMTEQLREVLRLRIAARTNARPKRGSYSCSKCHQRGHDIRRCEQARRVVKVFASQIEGW